MKIVSQYVSIIYLSYCGSFRALGIVECMVGYFKNKTKQMEQLCLDVACHKFDETWVKEEIGGISKNWIVKMN